MFSRLPAMWRAQVIFARAVASDLRAKYSGTALGLAWVVIGPLMLLTLYSAIYALIFRVRVPNLSMPEYVLNVFSGLVPFLAFAQALGSGASALQMNQGLLSNPNFSAIMIPAKSVLVAYVILPVGLIIIFIGDLAFSEVTTTWLVVPFVAVLQIMFSVGIGLFLSLISLVFRDIHMIIQYLVIALLVVTPIAYTPDMVPAKLQLLMYGNPLYYFISSYQHLVLANSMPPTQVAVGATLIAVTTFIGGVWFFRKTRRFLSDFI